MKATALRYPSICRAAKVARLLIVPLLLLPVACATEPALPNPGLKESFHTEIAANGAKRFSYSLEQLGVDAPKPYTKRSSKRSDKRRMATGSRGTQWSRGSRQRVYFDQGLELKLQQTAFCRDGYFELERSVSGTGGEVRGECRDEHVPSD